MVAKINRPSFVDGSYPVDSSRTVTESSDEEFIQEIPNTPGYKSDSSNYNRQKEKITEYEAPPSKRKKNKNKKKKKDKTEKVKPAEVDETPIKKFEIIRPSAESVKESKQIKQEAEIKIQQSKPIES